MTASSHSSLEAKLTNNWLPEKAGFESPLGTGKVSPERKRRFLNLYEPAHL